MTVAEAKSVVSVALLLCLRISKAAIFSWLFSLILPAFQRSKTLLSITSVVPVSDACGVLGRFIVASICKAVVDKLSFTSLL